MVYLVIAYEHIFIQTHSVSPQPPLIIYSSYPSSPEYIPSPNMASSDPATGAGVLLAFLKPTSAGSNEAQPDDQLALLSTAITGNVLGIKSATQYKAANTAYNKQHLFVCETEDLARVNIKQMLKFLESENMGGEWDVRAYSEVQIFGPGKSGGMSAHHTSTQVHMEMRDIIL